ncbi:hypothetical protein BD324DRAFT_288558 [Kockovaella imperatae]|uniref:Uncharacterized protein n=1 Tax=Kockovaella imperatae TaxID=4999 RepID=A0A1Y1U702_9TREE|nr:hypothetical protein BD324DRAFT_288558 [Kockovaella imperatae]ORX33314.1 hypothetical protein BD324DRAFT_288558 [Kockovaella imperatae]
MIHPTSCSYHCCRVIFVALVHSSSICIFVVYELPSLRLYSRRLLFQSNTRHLKQDRCNAQREDETVFSLLERHVTLKSSIRRCLVNPLGLKGDTVFLSLLGQNASIMFNTGRRNSPEIRNSHSGTGFRRNLQFRAEGFSLCVSEGDLRVRSFDPSPESC